MVTYKLKFLSRRLLTVIAFLVCSFLTVLYSQNKENYELLWEIHHKDSDKKSYIFGTMHLKDKRLFDFSDAMLPAIENSDAFALELHPESFMEAIENEMGGSEVPATFKRVLTEEEYRKLEDRFLKHNGYPLENFTGKNFLYIETLLTPEIVKDDDVFTVLDTFLYAIADTFGKEVYGLEEMEDQIPSTDGVTDEEIREYILEILEGDEEEYKLMLENMVQIYSRGNLTEIFEFMGKDTLDPSLKYRNRIMTNSIKEITKEKTLFAAVGAAHLPGESGIIEMLRKDGYTVNKVESPFTGLSNNFVPKPNLNKWISESYPELGFSLKLPSRPIPLTFEDGYDLNVSFDLITANQYAYIAIDMYGKIDEGQTTEQITETFINYFMEGEDTAIVNRKTINKSNIPFEEILFHRDSKYYRVQTGLSNNVLYFFYTENDKIENLNTEYSNAFFSSITIHGTIDRNTIWKDYHEEKGAYAIKIPNGEVQKFISDFPNPFDAEGEPIKMHIFGVTDPMAKTAYLIRYNDQPVGYYLENEAASLQEFKEYFQSSGRLVNEPRPIIANGQEGYEFEGYIKEVHHLIARVFFRGNRVYLLLAVKDADAGKVNRSNPFFSSFEFTEYITPQFDFPINLDNNYEIAFPGNTKTVESDEFMENIPFGKSKYYFSINPNTGGTYLLEQVKLKDYFKINSKEEFYTSIVEGLKEEGDSIIQTGHIKINGLDAIKVLMNNEKTTLLQQIVLLVDNDNLFKFQVYSSAEKQEGDFTDVFFNGFRKNIKKDYFDMYSNKTPQILKNLTSKNPEKQAAAIHAFDYYIFEEDDLPLLEKYLNKSYDDDDNYLGIKNLIIKEMGFSGNSSSVVALKKLYHNPRTKNLQKIAILEAVANIEAPEAVEAYSDLFFNHPPTFEEGIPYNIFTGLYRDDFKLSDHHVRLKELLNQQVFRGEIISYLAHKVNTDSLALPFIKEQSDSLLQYFSEDSQTYVDTFPKEEYYPLFDNIDMENYLFLIDTLKPRTQNLQKGLNLLSTQLDASNWIKTRAIITSIHNGIVTDKVHFDKVMDTLFSRFEVMEALVKTNKKELIPEAYLEGVDFSKLSLYNYIGYYSSFPQSIQLMGEFHENNKKFLAFSFVDENDLEAQYLAVVEDMPIDFDNFAQNPVFFEGGYLSENWKEQAKNMVLEYSYFSE